MYKNKWENGYGVIVHSDETKISIHKLVKFLIERKRFSNEEDIYQFLHGIDLLCNQAISIVAHTSYANNFYFDRKDLAKDDFKPTPEGHMGGSLNMVPAYLGYMGANYLSEFTRSWMMGQGHCVIAIDTVNILTNNLYESQAKRYSYSEKGISKLCQDFYSYRLSKEGNPEAPLGSHVGAHTAGGIIEGGYLGFAELLYSHAALKGEKLVTFLSDGAFEEQRGGDWFPRWWRAEDCGITIPVMIANGRRIDQRTTMQQQGGVEWLKTHLRNNSFDPITIDGKDPAAFIAAIINSENNIQNKIDEGNITYPIKMPYIIAETIKGFGFPGAGSNKAHNLPLGNNPFDDEEAKNRFNEGINKLWVDTKEIELIRNKYFPLVLPNRVKEKIHPLASREVVLEKIPKLDFYPNGQKISPMEAIDEVFVKIAASNKNLRIRLGNPDELRSNRMNKTLDLLMHRVTAPENGISESITGSVITALNEEAVVCAALGNKGGINLSVTYEAFAVKMLGAIRQEVIFAANQTIANKEPRWLSVPVIVTSHTWENGKNEHSHQDTTFAEALLGENSYHCRVLFPADANSAQFALNSLYQTQGKIFCLVVPKNKIANVFNEKDSKTLWEEGVVIVKDADSPQFILTAIGAYQLEEANFAMQILAEKGIHGRLLFMQEPGKFKKSQGSNVKEYINSDEIILKNYPSNIKNRLFISHTRIETMIGVLRKIDTGINHTKFLGYINKGGTLSTKGMLFTNDCSRYHIIKEIAGLLNLPLNDLLDAKFVEMLDHKGGPQ
jgi:phosphoketolase